MKELEHLQELQNKAMDFWRRDAKCYRELIPEYRRLLAKKKEINEKGGSGYLRMDKLPESVISELPKIPFFDIEDESEANTYVHEQDYISLIRLLFTIRSGLNSYSYDTIKNKNYDYRWQIEHYGQNKRYGFDPNYCHCGPSRSSRTNSMAVNRLGES